MDRRGGKREGAGRKKSPALTKITREINQKHWRANHHSIYLENRFFSSWRKISAGEPLATIRTSLHGCSVWSSDEGKKMSEYKYQLVLYFRRVYDIYTGQKCLNISSFFVDRMRWKRLANQPKERDIPYKLYFLPEIIHVYYLYFSYLTRVFFVMFNARSIYFEFIGQRQRSSWYFYYKYW